jgi:hypothetical protein
MCMRGTAAAALVLLACSHSSSVCSNCMDAAKDVSYADLPTVSALNRLCVSLRRDSQCLFAFSG